MVHIIHNYGNVFHNCGYVFHNYGVFFHKYGLFFTIVGCGILTLCCGLADSKSISATSSRPMDGTTIRPLYNAFWSIDSFCIYQQGVTDIMHTWSLGILDYVIFSSVNEIISYLRSFKLRGTARRQGEEIHPPLFTDAFIRRLFTDEVPKLVKNIDQNTACLVLPKKARLRMGKIATYLMMKSTNSGKGVDGPGNLQASTTDCFGQCIPILVENIFDFKMKMKGTGSRDESINDVIERNRANLLEHREDPSPRITASMCSLLKVKHSLVSEA